jgi:hypothetical protein
MNAAAEHVMREFFPEILLSYGKWLSAFRLFSPELF